MNKAVPAIEISNMPDVLHLAEEVRASKKPRILKVHGETFAMVMPVGIRQKPHAPRHELWENYDPQQVQLALQKSAKTLEGVDKNQLLTDIKQQREQASCDN